MISSSIDTELPTSRISECPTPLKQTSFSHLKARYSRRHGALARHQRARPNNDMAVPTVVWQTYVGQLGVVRQRSAAASARSRSMLIDLLVERLATDSILVQRLLGMHGTTCRRRCTIKCTPLPCRRCEQASVAPAFITADASQR